MSQGEPDRAAGPGLGLVLGRVLGVAALVVVASAALFLGLGRVAGDAPVVADGPDGSAIDEPEGADADPDEEQGTADGSTDSEPSDGETSDDDGREDEPGDTEEDDADARGDAEDAPDADGDTDGGPDADGDDAEGADEEADGEPAFEPGEVTVQVLDGYQDDGGAAASAAAEALREEGYRVVAENPALRYDATTVLWTSGHEEQARQVAAAIGAAEVREQPGNLSGDVMVHVVVGADRG